MMLRNRTNLLLAIAAILPAAAVGVAWLAAMRLHGSTWAGRLSLLTDVLVLASVAASFIMARAARAQLAALKFLDLLSQADISEVRACDPKQIVCDIPDNSPWFGIFGRIRQRLLATHERLERLEMKQAALEVRAHRHAQDHDRIAAILENIDDPIVAVDEYDELLLANPSAEDLFRFDARRDEKQALASLIRCEELIELLNDTRRRKGSNQRSCELEITGGGGEPQSYRATARALDSQNGHNGNGRGAVAVLRDIGGQRQLQKRHAEFVSAVSHEMKTPLAGIKAYVELLADGDAEDEETFHEFLHVIDSQADRLQRLVENLLNIARIEAGVVKVSKEEQSLNELLEQVYELMKPKADEKQIELVNELSGMYLGVFVDRDMMLQAAINLLSNAIKYTPEGKRVTLRSRLAGNSVEIDVEDEGVGLSEEDQVRVFEKFYRVNKDKSMASGTGLGLPLAKHIVEDVHQGELRLTSKLGAGSQFTIRLPGARQVNRSEPSATLESVSTSAN